MGALIPGFALPLLVSVSPAAPDAVARWRPEIAEAATRFSIPERWIERVMRAESGGRTRLEGRPIRSPKGAIGLMQLMPGTWTEMRVRLGLGDNPDDPRDNILAGSCYLRLMYDRFGYPGLFGAYNAGPARYAAWLAGRARLPGETLAYLEMLGGSAADAKPDAVADKPGPSLFVVLRAPASPDRQPPDDAQLPALFAIRKGQP
jgi:soluble lytic murein transglycosylase-like protein